MQNCRKRLFLVILSAIVLSNGFSVVENAMALEPPEDAPGVERIIFVSDRKAKKNRDIFAMDADGQNVDRITTHAKQDITPSWSRDGTRIVFSSTRESHFERVYVMNNDGESVQVITSGDRDLTPSWSPNENWIALVHTSPAEGLNYDVWIVRFVADKKGKFMLDPFPFPNLGAGDKENSWRVTTNSAQDESPAWSPNGKQIAWSSNRTGNYDIWVMDVAGDKKGGNKKNLTNAPGDDKNPSWQYPWGEKFVFDSDRDGDAEIFVMDSDGGNIKQLTKNVFIWDAQPTWSPNGKQIAWSTNRDRNNEIYIMDANGKNPTNLTNDKGYDASPDWFDPRIAFTVSPQTKRAITWGEIKRSGLKRAAK